MSTPPHPTFQRPYVVSWNLTYRCNLACEHCYLDAGGSPEVTTDEFSDRSELTTEQCYEVIDQIVSFAPECLTILTGGEPLLRRDILSIVRYAAGKNLWVVVGTNGISITDNLARILLREGVRGMALSLDALTAEVHDRFRRVRGAWQNTVEGARILRGCEMPFIVQTTVGAHNAGDLESIADFVHDDLSAEVWNLYFLVQTGRGQYVSDMTGEQYDAVLADLSRIQKKYRGRMVCNAKCAPHYIKRLFEEDPASPFIRTFAGGAGGCPAGTHYLGIRPNGDLTPCPYLPLFAGNVRETPLSELWESSELFTGIRRRTSLGGRCGPCEFNGHCGGCRARAYGMTGDYLAEDPLCTHTPGTFPDVARLTAQGIEYGSQEVATLEWDTAARDGLKRIPAFVRGMVSRSVEDYCRKNGLSRVTPEVMRQIRSRMPTPKLFGRRK